MRRFATGGILKRSTRADCKSAGLRLPRFESLPHHHSNPNKNGVFSFISLFLPLPRLPPFSPHFPHPSSPYYHQSRKRPSPNVYGPFRLRASAKACAVFARHNHQRPERGNRSGAKQAKIRRRACANTRRRTKTPKGVSSIGRIVKRARRRALRLFPPYAPSEKRRHCRPLSRRCPRMRQR